jgi:hypothetical protein
MGGPSGHTPRKLVAESVVLVGRSEAPQTVTIFGQDRGLPVAVLVALVRLQVGGVQTGDHAVLRFPKQMAVDAEGEE